MAVLDEVGDLVAPVPPHIHRAVRVPRHQVPAVIVGQANHVLGAEEVL